MYVKELNSCDNLINFLWAYPLVVYILYLALLCIHKTILFMMEKLAFSCCKLFILEGRNVEALDSIEKDAKVHPDVDALVNVFQDKDYNHVCYTLVFGIRIRYQGQDIIKR